MNDYRSSTPRLALGIASLAMTVATLSLFVIVPAMTGSADGNATKVADSAPAAVNETVITLGRIEVRGSREPKVAAATTPPVGPQRVTQLIGTDLQNIHRVSAGALVPPLPLEARDSSSETPAHRKQ